MGNGFTISKNLKIKKPVVTEKTLNGRQNNVTTRPAISSITIHPGSFWFKSFSAPLAIPMANKINMIIKKMYLRYQITYRKSC